MLTRADPTGSRVLVFGAGGAARAIAVETALAGAAHITVVNRDAGRGQELSDLIANRTPATSDFIPWDHTIAIPAGTNIVINATSIGFHPDVDAHLDFDTDTLQPGMVVADVITNPPTTNLVRAGQARGCITIDGLGMLVNQALVAIKLWTGKDVDGAVMRAVLEDLFGTAD
jgi:shikimate dehydrogenase